MRRICIILFLLPLICYGCATYTNKPQTNANQTNNVHSLIYKMLANNERIALVFLVTYDVIDGRPSSTSEKSHTQSIAENEYLKELGNYKNFSIVSRNHLKNSLDEITLRASGLISNETRVRIGELTGATHLYLIESNYYSHFFGGGKSIIYFKLVDIQTGKLLASDRFEIYVD